MSKMLNVLVAVAVLTMAGMSFAPGVSGQSVRAISAHGLPAFSSLYERRLSRDTTLSLFFANTSGTGHAWPIAGDSTQGDRRRQGAILGAIAGGILSVLASGGGCHDSNSPGSCATGNGGAATTVDREANAFAGIILGATVGYIVGRFLHTGS